MRFYYFGVYTEVYKFEKDFFVIISFISPSVESFPHEGILRCIRIYFAKTKDLRYSSIKFADVGAVIATVKKRLGNIILHFAASTVSTAPNEIRKLSSKFCLSV